MTEDEMVGWHHRFNGYEFEQALGVGDGQGSLACCSPWGCKESDRTERLNWTDCPLCSTNWVTSNNRNVLSCSSGGHKFKIRVSQDCSPWRNLGRNAFFPFLASDVCWQCLSSLACGGTTSLSVPCPIPLATWHTSLSPCVSSLLTRASFLLDWDPPLMTSS